MPRTNPVGNGTPKPGKADLASRAAELGDAAEPEDVGLFTGNVAFRLSRLEPMVAWALAGYTSWVNVLFVHGDMQFWLVALCAAGIAGWGRMYPARAQVVMLLRGLFLLVGAFILHTLPGSGGAIGAFFFWPLLIAVYYALLLAKPWAILLIVLSAVEFAASLWWGHGDSKWQSAMAHGAILVIAPTLALVFGRTMRQSEERTESTLRDGRTQFYNETGFFVHGAELLAECNRQGRPFTMALLNAADLHDIRDLLGHKVANDLFTHVVQSIGSVRGEGIAARVDAVEFALLLPGVTTDQAGKLIERRLGDPPTVEVKINDHDVVIGLDVVIAQAQPMAQTLEDLYDALHARWAKAVEPEDIRAKVPLLADRPIGAHRATSRTVPMSLGSPQELQAKKGRRQP